MSDLNVITTREYLETILKRIETTIRTELDLIRDDIQDLKDNYVTKAEYESTVKAIFREIDRGAVDRKESIDSVRTSFGQSVDDLRTTIANDAKKNIALAGLLIGIIEFVSRHI